MSGQSIQQLRRIAQRSSMRAIDHLLCYLLGCTRTELYAHPEQRLNAMQLKRLTQYSEQYQAGRPLAQIVGSCEFFSLPFEITPQVLIPRPETELLVATVLPHLKPGAVVLELGVGCGAIAIALAKNCPWISKIIATDIRHDVLQLARKNAVRHRVNNIEFRYGSWFGAVKPHESFDVIVSNPPYVATADPHLDANVAAYEPAIALFAGAKGLDHLHTIIGQSHSRLKPAALLALEHAPFQRTDRGKLHDQRWPVANTLPRRSGAFAARNRGTCPATDSLCAAPETEHQHPIP